MSTKLNATKSSLKPQSETDESQSTQKQPSFEEKINSIIETMESKYTSNLTDRHVDEIQNLIKEMNSNNYAFYYRELESLAHLISLQFQRIIHGQREFLPVLLSIVLCGVIEYTTSIYLEYVNHLKYWDYFHVVELDKALAVDETTKEQNRDRLISIFSKDKQYRK